MRIRSVLTHSSQVVLEGALVALLVVGLVAGTALAAKGGGGGHGKPGGGSGSGATGTIGLAPLVVDRNGNGTPNWNDVVTFNISTSLSQPWVHLVCSQSGTMVAQGWAGYFDGALGGRNFGLASPGWSGGAADCTARLETGTGSVVGSTSFHVDG